MKKINLILILTFVSVTLFAQIPKGYYDGTEGEEGYTLKTILHNIIDGHNDQGYAGLYDGYETTDVDNYYENDGTVLDMYSENPTGSDPYNWTHNNDHCGTYQTEGDCWNREHLIPQSFFNESSPMVSDIHFVIPSDGKVNGNRSNNPIAEVGSASWTSLNGSKLGSCSTSGYSGTVFEPIDEFKGDIARMFLYFVTRYEGQLGGFDPSNSKNTLDGSEDRGYEQWYIDMLMAWHEQDPVSQREIDRNNAAYAHQGNRNPFIDHPEFVQCIWGGGCNGLYFTSSPVLEIMETLTYTYEITYNVDIDDETIECTTKPDWLTFTKDEANNTATLTGTPTTAGSYDVVLTLTETGSEDQEQAFTIEVIPFAFTQNVVDEDFASCLPATWLIYNAAGDHDWQCVDQAMEVNAYGSDAACDDWLISSEINLDTYENEILTFDSYNEYDDNGIASPEMKLKYSTNYLGSGDPENATWTNLTYTYQTTGVPTFTASGDVDLSAISGSMVYLAFHYTSSGTAAASSTLWKVDNILLVGDVIQNVENLENIKTNLFPNPTTGNTVLEYNLTKSTNVEIVIYDVVGNKIETIENNYKNAGNFSNNLNLDNYKSGIYFIKINTDYSNNTQKVIKK